MEHIELPLVHAPSYPTNFSFILPLNLTVMSCRPVCGVHITLFAMIELELTERDNNVN